MISFQSCPFLTQGDITLSHILINNFKLNQNINLCLCDLTWLRKKAQTTPNPRSAKSKTINTPPHAVKSHYKKKVFILCELYFMWENICSLFINWMTDISIQETCCNPNCWLFDYFFEVVASKNLKHMRICTSNSMPKWELCIAE